MSAFIKNIEGWDRSDERRALKVFWDDMQPTVINVVTLSFDKYPVRNLTKAAIDERVVLAKKIVDEMRADYSWSSRRIKDTLAVVLGGKLAGLEISLEAMNRRGSW